MVSFVNKMRIAFLFTIVIILFWTCTPRPTFEKIPDNIDLFDEYVLQQNPNQPYQLGDVVRGRRNIYKSHEKYYPNSIAADYIRQANTSNDMNLLKTIIDQRTHSAFHLFQDYVMVHLRIGDVIDNVKCSVDTLLSKGCPYFNGYNYVKPLPYFEDKLPSIDKYKLKKIMLFGGFHKNGNHSKSLHYVSAIKDFFVKKGYECKARINHDKDDDFIIMSNAKYFIKSGGGFSQLMEKIILMNGGIVF